MSFPGKKFKTETSSKNLQHYFSRGSTTGSITSRNSVVSQSQGHKVCSSTKKLEPMDIISIDSDDEITSPITKESAKTGTLSKRARSTSSSDIEIIEAQSGDIFAKPSGSHSSTSSYKKKQKRNLSFNASRTLSDDSSYFGKPTMLLASSSSSADFTTTTTPNTDITRNLAELKQYTQPNRLLSPISSIPGDVDLGLPDDVEIIADPRRPAEGARGHEIRNKNGVMCPGGNESFEWNTGDDEIIEDSAPADASVGELDIIEISDDSDASEITSLAICPVKRSPYVLASHPTDSSSTASLLAAIESSSCESSRGDQPTAFSLLMTSHAENEAWKEASVAEDSFSRGTRRKAPFYKVLQGMPIAVDAFKYGSIPGVKAYFLTHAHSDHYTNLSSKWSHGPIYASEGTCNLILHLLKVDPKWVHPLPMDIAVPVPDTGGVTVTLIEANHCPGSSLFLFEGKQTINAGDSTYRSSFVGSAHTFRYLHCGDFRASPRHVLHPAIKNKRLDHVYLDTTYLDPKYTFPPQALVVSACADLARSIFLSQSSSAPAASSSSAKTEISSTPGPSRRGMKGWFTPNGKMNTNTVSNTSTEQESPKARILFVVGTYSIGKERIVKAIAKALNTKVYCDARKTAILKCQRDAELDALLTDDASCANVHLLPLQMISTDKLKEYVERFQGVFGKVIGFRPTGWTFSPSAGANMSPVIADVISRHQKGTFKHTDLKPTRGSTLRIEVYGVPYSEHSSFFELSCFAVSRALNWGKMIATVNVGSEKSRANMAKWIARWQDERKRRPQQEEIVQHRSLDYW